MILTLQFLLVAILPASLIFLAIRMRRSALPRPQLVRHWTWTLIAMAIWAGTVMRFYGGITLPPALIFTWGFIGRHVLSLAMFGVLLTTSSFIPTRRDQVKAATITSLVLIVAAILMDPAVWQLAFVNLSLWGWELRYFDIWAGVWVSACLLPLIAAWILAQNVAGGLPLSLFRNHTQYWVLTLLVFILGTILAVVQERDQPIWQEIGVVVNISAAALGTLTFTSSQLPDLPALLRRVLARLSSALLLFGLAVGAFYLVRQFPPRSNEILLLVLNAAAFTAIVFLLNHWGVISGRPAAQIIPSREQARLNEARENAANPLPNSVPGTFASLAHPQELGKQLLELARAAVAAEDAWLFWSEPGVGGRLILRGLTAVTDSGNLDQAADQPAFPQIAEFSADSPFTAHLRLHATPILQNDLFTLPPFDGLAAEEKQRFLSWQRVLYIPMHIGTRLIGLLALGKKHGGAAYTRQDFILLESLVALAGPFLVQASFTTTLQHINDHVFRQNKILSREKRELEARMSLYQHLLGLIKPELRRPLLAMAEQLEQASEERRVKSEKWQAASGDWQGFAASDDPGDITPLVPQSQLGEIGAQMHHLRAMVERLLALATLVCGQRPLNFAPVQLEDVIEDAVRALTTMADARRVRVTLNRSTTLPLVSCDAAQLQTALHHLLHNAIKFNRIGGTVTIDVGLTVSEVYLRISDTGVGITPEKLAALWQGFAPLPVEEREANGRIAGMVELSKAIPTPPLSLQDYRLLGRGLPIVHWIITAHGGRVEAQSVYGRGSTFTLYLPLEFQG